MQIKFMTHSFSLILKKSWNSPIKTGFFFSMFILVFQISFRRKTVQCVQSFQSRNNFRKMKIDESIKILLETGIVSYDDEFKPRYVKSYQKVSKSIIPVEIVVAGKSSWFCFAKVNKFLPKALVVHS